MGQTEQPATAGAPDTVGDSAPHEPVWTSCGQHRFYRRGDVLFWESRGPMTVPDLVVLFEERINLQRQHGHVFLLFDAQQIDGIPAESRRYAAQFTPDPPIRGGVVLLGAGLLMRTAVSLIMGASRLLGRKDLRTVSFATDEAEAWAILDRERLALGTAPPL